MTLYIVEISQRKKRVKTLTSLLGILPLSNRLILQVYSFSCLNYGILVFFESYQVLFTDGPDCGELLNRPLSIQNTRKFGITFNIEDITSKYTVVHWLTNNKNHCMHLALLKCCCVAAVSNRLILMMSRPMLLPTIIQMLIASFKYISQWCQVLPVWFKAPFFIYLKIRA